MLSYFPGPLRQSDGDRKGPAEGHGEGSEEGHAREGAAGIPAARQIPGAVLHEQGEAKQNTSR